MWTSWRSCLDPNILFLGNPISVIEKRIIMVSQPVGLNLQVLKKKKLLLRKEHCLVLMSNDWDH